MSKYTPANIFRGVLRRVKRAFTPDANRFLKQCRAVIHIGANSGGERDLYARYGLGVLWVEALPEVFQTLQQNLTGYPKQRAVNALVTDQEGQIREFHISNFAGVSSSIFEFKDHVQLWPDVSFTKTIQLTSTTLPTLVREAGSSPADFDALILDVQGAELLIIQGAGPVLDNLRFIKAEASDFESYSGACTVATLSQALAEKGFSIKQKECFATKPGVGSYFDILYERTP